MLDEYGMYMTYGEAVNSDEMRAQAICPKASSRAACCAATSRRTRSSRYDDVELPPGRLADSSGAEQYRHFFGSSPI